MKYIFVTGIGRSGTKVLASLLSHIKNARVERKFIGVRKFCPSRQQKFNCNRIRIKTF